MTTKTNMTAWTATPGQIQVRESARLDRFHALRNATAAVSPAVAANALRDVERADRTLRVLDAIHACQFPDELLRLSHAALTLMDSSTQCPHCMEGEAGEWRADIQGLEPNDDRGVLACRSCGGHWSVPMLWIEDASDFESAAD